MSTAMKVALAFLVVQIAGASQAGGRFPGHFDSFRIIDIADVGNPAGNSELAAVNHGPFTVEFDVELLTQGQPSVVFPVVLEPGESLVKEIRSAGGTAQRRVIGQLRLQLRPGGYSFATRDLLVALAMNDGAGKTEGVLQGARLRSDGELVQAHPARGGTRNLMRVGPGQHLEATVLNTCHLPVLAGVEITDLETGMSFREDVMVQPGDIGVLPAVPHADHARWIVVESVVHVPRGAQGTCPPGQGGLPGSTALRDDNDSITNPTMVEYGLLVSIF